MAYSDIERRIKSYQHVSLASTRVAVYDLHQRRPTDLQCICDKILKEENEWPCLTATIRIYNLATYLSLELNKLDDACKYNTQALALDDDNLTASVNRILILLRQNAEISQINAHCDKVEKLLMDKQRVIEAKAEIVHAYARYGNSYHNVVIKLYTDLLDECEQVNNTGNQWVENLCLWRFGLALTEIRLLNANSTKDHTTVAVTVEKRHEIAKQLQYLTEKGTGTEQPLLLLCRARSMVLLAKLLHDTPEDVRDKCYGTLKLEQDTFVLMTNALQLCPDDPFILERCGPLFRNCGFIEKSIQVLRKAVNQKETAFACEHLARSLIRQHFFKNYQIKPLRLTRRVTGGENHLLESLCTPRDALKLVNVEAGAVTDEILDLFDRSFELDNNYHALFEKGRFLRQIGRNEQALKIFRFISSRKASCSLMILANTYTHAVYCLMHELSDLWNNSEMLKLIEELKTYIKYSVELSLKLVTRFVYNDVKLVPVLTGLLQCRWVKYEEYYEINNLSSVLRSFGGAIGILVAIRRDPIIENIRTVVDRCMVTQHTEEAILGLQLISCLKVTEIDKKMITDVFVHGAIQAGLREDYDVAGIRLKDALTGLKVQAFQQEADEGLDIYMLCEPEEEESWRPLCRILQNVGLNVSLNLDNALSAEQGNYAGDDTFLGSTLDTCNSLLVCISSSVMTYKFSGWIAKALRDSRCSTAVVKIGPDANVPDFLSYLAPFVDIDLDTLKVEHRWTDKPFQQFLRNVLTKLAVQGRNI